MPRHSTHLDRPCRLALLTAVALVGGSSSARADGDTPPPLAAPAAPDPAPPSFHLQIGGSASQPDQPMHDVAVSSDSPGTRLLRIDATSGVFTFGQGVDGARQQICLAPCNAKMTPSGVYLIRGWGISDSPHFAIGDGTMALNIHTGSAVTSTLGGSSLTLGILGVIGGASFLTVALLEDSKSSDRSTFMNVGWGGVIGGAALIGVGVALGLTSVTHIYDGEGTRVAKAPALRLTPTGFVF